MPNSRFNDNSYAIIGAYYEVYNHLPRNFPEHIYEKAMLEELHLRGIPATRQDKYQLVYKGYPIGLQQLDLFVAGEIVVENKAVNKLTRLHKAQCISYIKTVNKQVGLLLNFGGPEPEYNRLYFNPAKKPSETPPYNLTNPPTNWLYSDLTYQVIGGLYEVHRLLGAGFTHRIYAKACYYELGLRGLAIEPTKRLQVIYKNKVVGDVGFAHLLIEGKIMLFPVATSRLEDIHVDTLKQWLAWRNIQLGILANFDAVQLEFSFIRV